MNQRPFVVTAAVLACSSVAPATVQAQRLRRKEASMSCVLRIAGPQLRGVLAATVLAVLLGSACSRSPVAPSPTPTPTPTSTPTPSFDLSPFVGKWALTLTDITGDGGCVGERMRSQIGVPRTYSLTVTNSSVIITDPAGGYECIFGNLKTDADSFTTHDAPGYRTCMGTQEFRCNDGTVYEPYSWGQDISGRLSGAGLSGAWDSGWAIGPSLPGTATTMTTQFTGTKQ